MEQEPYKPMRECWQCLEDYLALVDVGISDQSAKALAGLVHICDPNTKTDRVVYFLFEVLAISRAMNKDAQ